VLTVELIPDLEFGGFTARLPEIPVYGEGETAEDAIADLKAGLRGYIETFGLEKAQALAVAPIEFRTLEWNLAELARG
jgi:predicted RNase H-like HicB family nuclease